MQRCVREQELRTVMVARRVFLMIAAVSLLLGCSTRTPGRSTEPLVVDTERESVEPFKIEIEQELNDGERIVVVAKVTSRAPYTPERGAAVLELKASREGEVVASSHTVIPGPLAANATTSVPLLVTASQATDYQLSLLWGEDAAPFVSQPFVVVEDLQIFEEPPECAAESDCQPRVIVAGALVNHGGASCPALTLDVGAAPKLDKSPVNPQNVQRVELTGLNLQPQERRKVRFALRARPELSDWRARLELSGVGEGHTTAQSRIGELWEPQIRVSGCHP